MHSLRILVVEDEPKIAHAIEEGLRGEAYGVSLAQTAGEGFYRVNSEAYDLVLLDVMLPDRSGIEMLSTMRERGIQLPVLLLTARDALEDRVRGLDAGADDYLVKPFAFAELSARIRALLRRGKDRSAALLIRLDDLELDIVSRTVRRASNLIDLTPREFEVLEYLMRHQGRVVSREMLAREIWKETARHTPLDNVIDVHMARIRRKVDEGFANKLVHTVRGVGFVMRKAGEI